MVECKSNPFGGGGVQSSNLIAAKITACCEETNGNLTDIKTKLDSINTNLAACCTEVNNNLTTIAGILTQILNK